MADIIFTIWGGPGFNTEGTAEVGHEWIRLILGDEAIAIRLSHVTAVGAEERRGRDRVKIGTSPEVYEFEIDDPAAFLAAIPRSFHLGW